MKKTYSYFIISRYEKGILLSTKFAIALLLAGLAQFSAYGTPLNKHNPANNSKGLPKHILHSKISATQPAPVDIKVKGKVMDAHVVGGQKVGNGLDEEAVKAVSNMPSWKPGKVKGKNVKTRLELPISFQLEA